MDIYIIDKSDFKNIPFESIEEFKHRDFSSKKKLEEHCLTYFLLNKILKDIYKIQNRAICFENSKPYLISKEKFFSISHSEKYIVLAFSDFDCGVDIEKIKQRDFQSIAKRMNFNSATLEDFYKDWTKYEAEYKLGERNKSIYRTKIDDYILTAVSSNFKEKFKIHIQTGEMFSNL